MFLKFPVLLMLLSIQWIYAKNVLFVVVTSTVMNHRYQNVIAAIDSQLNTVGREDIASGLITVKNCGKGTAIYNVPLAKNNGKKIVNSLKAIRLEGTHEDLVEAMTLAKQIVSEHLQKKLGPIDIVLYAETHCACTSTNKHLEILKEIKEMNDKAKHEFNLDVITTATDEDLVAFFEQIVAITGGKAYGVTGLKGEEKQLDEILKRVSNQGVSNQTPKIIVKSKEVPKVSEKPKEKPSEKTQPKPLPAEKKSDTNNNQPPKKHKSP